MAYLRTLNGPGLTSMSTSKATHSTSNVVVMVAMSPTVQQNMG